MATRLEMSVRFLIFIPGSTEPPTAPVERAELDERVRSGDVPEGALALRVEVSPWTPDGEPPVFELGAGPFEWLPVDRLLAQPVPTEATVAVYEVTTDGTEIVGPVSRELLARGVAAGKVPADARVRSKGATEWLPVTQVLFEAPRAPFPLARTLFPLDEVPPSAPADSGRTGGLAAASQEPSEEFRPPSSRFSRPPISVALLPRASTTAPMGLSAPKPPVNPRRPSMPPLSAPSGADGTFSGTQAWPPPPQDSAPSLRALMPSTPPVAPMWDDEPLASVPPEDAPSLFDDLRAATDPISLEPPREPFESAPASIPLGLPAAAPTSGKPFLYVAIGLAVVASGVFAAVKFGAGEGDPTNGSSVPSVPVPVPLLTSPTAMASGSEATPPSAAVRTKVAMGEAEVLATKLGRPGHVLAGDSSVYFATYREKRGTSRVVSSLVSLTKKGGKLKVVLTGQPPISSLRMEPEQKYLYFSVDPEKGASNAFRIPVRGGFPLRLQSQPEGKLWVVGVGAKHAYLHWAGHDDGGLLAVPRRGGSSKVLFKGAKLLEVGVGDKLAAGCNAAVARFGLDGPRSEEIIERFDAGECDALAVDDGHVYWSHQGAIKQSDLSVTKTVHPGVRARTLKTTSSHLYWTSEGADGTWRIERGAKSQGGSVELLLEGKSGEPSFDVDDQHLYVADAEAGTVSRFALPR